MPRLRIDRGLVYRGQTLRVDENAKYTTRVVMASTRFSVTSVIAESRFAETVCTLWSSDEFGRGSILYII